MDYWVLVEDKKMYPDFYNDGKPASSVFYAKKYKTKDEAITEAKRIKDKTYIPLHVDYLK